MNEPTHLASALAKVFLQRKRLRKVDRARDAWITIAGDPIAKHTRVRSLLRGVLTVEVDSPPLCSQLAGFERDRLLLALKSEAGGAAVQDLRFRHGAFTE